MFCFICVAEVEIPPGWDWAGPWYIDPVSQNVDPESSQDRIIEEIFQNERYYPIRGWSSKVSKGALVNSLFSLSLSLPLSPSVS